MLIQPVHHSLLFLNMGGGELVIVMVTILLLFGAKKMPELARGLGKGIREFKDATNNIQREISSTVVDVKNDVRKEIEKNRKDIEENVSGKEEPSKDLK